jgi:hypothetical protein
MILPGPSLTLTMAQTTLAARSRDWNLEINQPIATRHRGPLKPGNDRPNQKRRSGSSSQRPVFQGYQAPVIGWNSSSHVRGACQAPIMPGKSGFRRIAIQGQFKISQPARSQVPPYNSSSHPTMAFKNTSSYRTNQWPLSCGSFWSLLPVCL